MEISLGLLGRPCSRRRFGCSDLSVNFFFIREYAGVQNRVQFGVQNRVQCLEFEEENEANNANSFIYNLSRIGG